MSGPYDRWPTGSGFDKFYGFIGGETNQWHPMVYDGTTRVYPKVDDPGYHFTTDMTNQALAWMNTQQSLTPDKPFYLYFATGATHAPHHAPKSYVEKYKGKFAQGWDKLREETLERQKKLGVVPQNTVLAPKPKDIKDWDKLTADEKRLFERQMESVCRFRENTPTMRSGRLVAALEERGELDNTLFFYIVGDNGSSAEGGHDRNVQREHVLQRCAGNPRHAVEAHRSSWGPSTPTITSRRAGRSLETRRSPGPSRWPPISAGHAMAWSCTGRRESNRRTRSARSFTTSSTSPLRSTRRSGIPAPRIVNGIEQRPMEGVSMKYSFDNAAAADTRKTQYFEMIGNRAIYHEGWFAGTIHKAPWEAAPRHPLTEDVWELYNVNEDFSQAINLAEKNPAKLEELKKKFMDEAVKYNVLPIDDRSIERFDPVIAGRPDLMNGRTKLILYEGAKGIPENAFINVKNTSLTITAEVDVPANASGVLLCQGGDFGGWTFYMLDGRPAYTYNWVGLESYTVTISAASSAREAHSPIRFRVRGWKRWRRKRNHLSGWEEGRRRCDQEDQQQHVRHRRVGRRGE